MYTAGLGAATAAVTTATVLSLPNTGSDAIISVALSVAAGLVAWGVLYSKALKKV